MNGQDGSDWANIKLNESELDQRIDMDANIPIFHP